MVPTHRAAWPSAKQTRIQVKDAPYTPPSKNEIVVKSGAVAIEPVDAVIKAMGLMAFGWIKYPFVIGNSLAGEVVQVGPGVTRFKPGDRIIGHTVGINKKSNRACEGAFQEYVVLHENLVAPIPNSLSYDRACVLPLTLSTASSGLFMKDFLALNLPTPKTAKNSVGQTLVVWGGSTSLGGNAIQLAVAAGYQVITTAGPKIFEYVKKLGASDVFDYHNPTAAQDIIALLKGKKCAGALAIRDGSMGPCIDIVAASSGRKFVAQASLPQPEQKPPKGFALVSFIVGFLWFQVSTSVKCRTKGVASKFIWGSDLMANEVGSAIYEQFLPETLGSGKYIAGPEPSVVGIGLEKIQDGLDAALSGGSAGKPVVLVSC